MKKILCLFHNILLSLRKVDFLGPLALRLYLAPIFWMAGMNKFADLNSTIEWFGNSQWGLGLPFPEVLATLAAGTEVLGAILLVTGLGVRWISIPLMIVMLMAVITVHMEHGWLAIAHESSEAHTRLQGFLGWLSENHPGRHGYITELGTPVMLNNGMEFSATYLIMLVTLFFTGAGRYVSCDYWLSRWTKC